MKVKQMLRNCKQIDLYFLGICLFVVVLISKTWAQDLSSANDQQSKILATLKTQPTIIIRSDDLIRWIRLKYNLTQDLQAQDLQAQDLQAQDLQAQDLKSQSNLKRIDLKAELDALIEIHLLAHQAKALNIDQEPALIDLSKKLSIEHYLKHDFEKTFSIDRLPQKYIDQSYEQNQMLFNHDELRGAVHVVFLPYQQKFTDLSKEEKALVYQDAKSFYDLLEQQVQPLSFERFVQLGEECTQKHLLKIRESNEQNAHLTNQPMPLILQRPTIKVEARYEVLGRFSKKGPFVEEFLTVVFQMKTAGRYSEIFETSFGYHVVFLKEVIPPLSTPPEIVDAQIRKKILPEVQQFELNQILDRQFRLLQPEIYPLEGSNQ